jgi:CRP-like cAMP-binding protein
LGQRTGAGIQLGAPLSRKDLAEMTGTTLFTVSWTLKEWERRGILIARREQVVIVDPHALTIIGEDLPDGRPA